MCVYISYPSTILAIKLSDSTRWETAELEEACYPIGFQLIDESEDSRGCAPWETGHTPLLPLDLGGLRPPDYNWSIEGCMGEVYSWSLGYEGRIKLMDSTLDSTIDRVQTEYSRHF